MQSYFTLLSPSQYNKASGRSNRCIIWTRKYNSKSRQNYSSGGKLAVLYKAILIGVQPIAITPSKMRRLVLF